MVKGLIIWLMKPSLYSNDGIILCLFLAVGTHPVYGSSDLHLTFTQLLYLSYLLQQEVYLAHLFQSALLCLNQILF